MSAALPLLFVSLLAGLAAVIQLSFVSASFFRLGLDAVGLAVVYWLVRRDVLAAVLTAVVAGGLTDYLLGWRAPGHLFIWLSAIGLFFLFARRWFAAQTTSATWLNILVVWLIVGAARWLLAGWPWVSYADQQFVNEQALLTIVSRAVVAGLAAALWQRYRRGSFIRLGVAQ